MSGATALSSRVTVLSGSLGNLVGVLQRLRPAPVAALGTLMALGVVLGRLLVPADGDISRFVVAGDAFVDPATVDPPIYVYEDSWGYDGQFFWRLAVDPAEWDLDRPHHGVMFDSAYRPPRIVYPALAWALAGGRAESVATTLVAVNVLAYAAIAGLGALIAQGPRRPAPAAAGSAAGRHPALSGLLVATTPGLVFALSRDLSDAVTLAALLAGIVALQRGRFGWAAVAWTGAVLTREQALVVIAGYGLWRLATLARQGWQARPSLADLPWLLPPAVTVAWQALVWARVGELPFAASQDANFTFPFVALGPELVDWVQGDVPPWDDVVPFQFALAVLLVALAFRVGREQLADDDRWLLVSLGLVVVVAVSFGAKVWEGPADLRQVLDVFAVSWVVLLSCPRRIPPPVVAAAVVVWLATAVIRSCAI